MFKSINSTPFEIYYYKYKQTN
eukprot:SAG31_NODE_15407_length_756_cov_15.106545_1_plen_21_part_10